MLEQLPEQLLLVHQLAQLQEQLEADQEQVLAEVS